LIKNILIIDTETTSLKPSDGKLIEVAAILYNLPTKSILNEVCTLLPAETNPVEHINHISVASLDEAKGVAVGFCMAAIGALMVKADALIAHYVKFDRPWIEAQTIFTEHSKDKLWICTKEHIDWRKGKGLKLSDIAEHFKISYEGAHRAMADCHILLKCLQRLPDLQEQLDFYDKGRAS
jgi:DNA polymerase-3 subunit epsilon